MTPAVSFLLPVHNAGRYLAAATDSISAQEFADFEVIAVDDGSTDASGSGLERWAARDPRVRVVHQPNGGIVTALNRAIAESRAPLLARMDADDVAHPDRLARQVAFLAENPGCVALGSSVWVIDRQGDRLKVYNPPQEPDRIRTELLGGNGGALIHPAVVFRRGPVETAGLYRREWNFIEDLDLFLRLLDLGTLANLPLPLLDYRAHPQSTNSTRAARQAGLTQLRLATFGATPTHAAPPALDLPAQHRQWASWALEGGNTAAARRHARSALLRQPWSRDCWSFWRYVRSRTRS